ncbi:ATP-grasp domain-containing protein, partial [Streptomyces sp. NPDC057638]
RALFTHGEGAGGRLLLQRYLPDTPDGDWFFHGYFAGPRSCLLGGSGRKELSWPVRTGLTAKGRWQPNPRIEAAALRLAAQVGYHGILDLDFRREPGTGLYQLLDVNPRPGAQFRLFTSAGGLDVVRALYLDLTGQPVPRQPGRPGRVFVAENYAVLSSLASAVPRRGAPAGPRRTAAAGQGVETAWFAGDDPWPFLAMTRAWLGRGLAKGARSALRRTAARTPRRTDSTPSPLLRRLLSSLRLPR